MNIRENINNIIIGLDGEKRIRDIFIKKKIKHMQIDLIFMIKDQYKLAEIKHQEPFDPPPFKGHGLPKWQIEARIELYNKTGIEPYLFIVDKKDNNIYFNSLLNLEKGEYIDTMGSKPRRVYNIKSFKIFNEYPESS